MAQSVEDFKKEWQDKVRTNPVALFPAEQQAKLTGSKPSDFSVKFGSDKSIEAYLAGGPAAACCVVCISGPFGIDKCQLPPGASCDDMCG